jgi:Cytochrome c oxidase subunit III
MKLTLPLIAALGGFMLTSGLVLYMHKFIGGWSLLVTGFSLILYVLYTWWRDVIREATFEGQHSIAVQKGLRLGMILCARLSLVFCFLICQSDMYLFFTSCMGIPWVAVSVTRGGKALGDGGVKLITLC